MVLQRSTRVSLRSNRLFGTVSIGRLQAFAVQPHDLKADVFERFR